MRDFTKHASPRQRPLRLLAGVAGIIALFFVTFGAARAAWGMYGKFAEAAKSDAEAQQNVIALEAEELQMSAAVETLSSARGQEAALRQSYGVALPGEGEIQIVKESTSSTPAPAPQPNFFVRILKALWVW